MSVVAAADGFPLANHGPEYELSPFHIPLRCRAEGLAEHVLESKLADLFLEHFAVEGRVVITLYHGSQPVQVQLLAHASEGVGTRLALLVNLRDRKCR